MRDTKKRSLRSLLSTRQWVILEILFLANSLVAAIFGVLAFPESFARLRPWQPDAPTEVVALAAAPTATPVSTPTPLATETPSSVPSATLHLIPTESLAPTSTPTSVIPGLSATPVPTSTGVQPEPLPNGALRVRTGQGLNAPTASPPPKVLLDVAGRGQSLPLSCESRSAADWAAFFGTRIDELEFFSRLPLSDNPDAGFAGDVNGKWGQVPPNDYGVHAGPVAALLRDYGLSAEARRGMTWEELQSELIGGRPVIAWVVGHVWPKGKAVDYAATDGALVTVAPYEHTIMVVGYSDDSVIIRDGARLYTRSLSTFLGSWAVLGNMAVTAGS